MNYKNLLKTSLLSTMLIFSVGFAAENPSTVENLRLTSMDGAIQLDWDKATDSDGIILDYVIYYGTTPLSETSDGMYPEYIETDSAETTYTVEGLSNGITYYFTVTAEDEENNESEDYSLEESAMPRSEAIDSPTVISAKQISTEEIEIVMSEPVSILSRTQAVSVIQKNKPSNELEVLDVNSEGAIIYLKTEANRIKSGVVYEITVSSAVEDLDGNPVNSGVTDMATFTGKNPSDFIIEEPIVIVDDNDVLKQGETLPVEKPDPTPFVEPVEKIEPIVEPVVAPLHPAPSTEVDEIPPADATNLIMDSSKVETDGKATLIWTPAIDTDEDIIDQMLYTKEGNGNWDAGYSVGKATAMEELAVKVDMTYMVRVVTVDKSGNQSNGIATTFSTQLSKTGPSAGLFFGIALFVGVLFIVSKRRA